MKSLSGQASASLPIAFEVPVNARVIRGLRWGNDAAEVPTLALHGWLDNAASFAMIAPELPQLQLWAIDMPGHGWSDHRRPPGSYNIWDDLLDILALADQLGWQRFNILAHSRGAIISVLLAATMPERIARMVLLDGIWPMPSEAADSPSLLRQYLLDQRRAASKKSTRYTSVAEAVAARQRATGLGQEAAAMIVERSIEAQDDGSFSWRSDPRLMLSSAFKLTRAHIDAFVEALSTPTLLLLAAQGFARYPGIDEALRQFPHIECRTLPGGHHLHMEEASTVAPLVAAFLQLPEA